MEFRGRRTIIKAGKKAFTLIELLIVIVDAGVRLEQWHIHSADAGVRLEYRTVQA